MKSTYLRRQAKLVSCAAAYPFQPPPDGQLPEAQPAYHWRKARRLAASGVEPFGMSGATPASLGRRKPSPESGWSFR